MKSFVDDMKKFWLKIIILLLYLMYSSLLSAQEEGRAYDLKVKLKPKIIESKAYLPEMEEPSWEQEMSKWKVGFLQDIELDYLLHDVQFVSLAEAKKEIQPFNNGGCLRISFLGDKSIVLSKMLDVDIKEFPFLRVESEYLLSGAMDMQVFILLDDTGDGKVDGYLPLDSVGEYNVLELTEEQWHDLKERKNGVKVKSINFFLYSGKKEGEENGYSKNTLAFNEISFYAKNSVILTKKKFSKNNLIFEDMNTISRIGEKDGVITAHVCFESFDDVWGEPGIENGEQQKSEKAGLKIYIPVDEKSLRTYPYIRLYYKPEDQNILDIELALLAKNGVREKTVILPKNMYRRLDNEIEINFNRVISKCSGIESLIIKIVQKPGPPKKNLSKQWYRFQVYAIEWFAKFPWPMKRSRFKEYSELICKQNPPLLIIDQTVFYLNDFENRQGFNILDGDVSSKRIQLTKGDHKYKKLENDNFDVEWVILEPEDRRQKTENRDEPEIIFKKINPTKYLVDVKGAKESFWLVFSESFHEQWRLYNSPQSTVHSPQIFGEVVAEYPGLRVKEAKHTMRFTPGDIRFLFKKPLDVFHQMVNGYANGWYIEPDKLGLGEDFTLVLYFYPQSLFYLGLLISGITLLGCIGYLGYSGVRKGKVKSGK